MTKFAYTLDEAAQQSGVSVRGLYRKLKSGELKARRNGRRTVILHEDLMAWLTNLPVAELEAA